MCSQILPVDMFHKRGPPDKLSSSCKDCKNKRARDLHEFRKEKHSKRMKKHYSENKEYYQQKNAKYSRTERGREVQRKGRKKYLSTEKGRESHKRSIKQYYNKNRHKFLARWAVKSAVASGKLIRGLCEICGVIENINAHHEDYSKKLDVIWLCVKHHKEKHRKIEIKKSQLINQNESDIQTQKPGKNIN